EFTVPLDRFIRTVGWNRAARGHLGQWDELSTRIAQSYSAGTRAWLQRMPARPVEYEFLEVDPDFGEAGEGHHLAASAAVFMAWSLSANWDCELLRHEIADTLGWEALATLFPVEATNPAAARPGK